LNLDSIDPKLYKDNVDVAAGIPLLQK
jgi:hypothetical protein